MTYALSPRGLASLANEEGFVDHPYPDGEDADGNTIYSIAFGHQIRDGERFPNPISRGEGEALLARDVAWTENLVNRAVRVPLTQAQFDALVSLAYNLPITMNERESTLLRLLNAGDYAGAADQFRVWRIFKGQVDARLVARRARERAMFESDLPTSPEIPIPQGPPSSGGLVGTVVLLGLAAAAAYLWSTST